MNCLFFFPALVYIACYVSAIDCRTHEKQINEQANHRFECIFLDDTHDTSNEILVNVNRFGDASLLLFCVTQSQSSLLCGPIEEEHQAGLVVALIASRQPGRFTNQK